MTPLLFLGGSTGPLELLVIFAAILVLFGPRKLPEIARSIGRMLHELRKASDDFRSQIMSIEGTDKPVETQIDKAFILPPPQEPTREDFPPPNVRIASASLMEGERPSEPDGGFASPSDVDDAGSTL